MAEMNAADAAKEIDRFANEFDSKANPINYSSKTIKAMRYAASLCRKVAAGELREVVHARWALARESERCYLVKCTNCGHSVAIAANVPIDEWRVIHRYCVDCGSLMGGKDGSNDNQA